MLLLPRPRLSQTRLIPHRSHNLRELLLQRAKPQYYLARHMLDKNLKMALSKDLVLKSRRAQREHPQMGCVASLAADGFVGEVFA